MNRISCQSNSRQIDWYLLQRERWLKIDTQKLNCPSSKGNHALPKNLKDLMEKTQNPKFFWNQSRIGAASSLVSSMKHFFWRFESYQNKWKSMTVLIVLHLKPKTLLYYVEFFIYINIKCPNSWLKNFLFSVKWVIFESAVWAL